MKFYKILDLVYFAASLNTQAIKYLLVEFQTCQAKNFGKLC